MAVIGVIWYAEAWIYPDDSQTVLSVTRPYIVGLRAAFYLTALLTAVSYGSAPVLQFAARHPLLVFLAGLSWASLLWAPDPASSVDNLLNFSLLIVTCAYLCRMPKSRLVTTMWMTMAAILLVSAFLVALVPQYGLMAGMHSGQFRGTFSHKSNFGLFLAIFLCFTIGHHRFIEAPAILKCALSILAAFLVVGSGSATSLLMCAFYMAPAVVLGRSFRLLRSTWARGGLVICVALAVILLSFSLSPEVLAGLDRDPTMTGRTAVWAFFLDRAGDAPWVGHGAYSIYADNDLIMLAGQALFFGARSPHNGYIELYYNLGIIGLAGFVVMMAGYVTMSGLAYVQTEDDGWKFAFLLACVLLAYTVVESYQSGLNAGLPFLCLLTSIPSRGSWIARKGRSLHGTG
ncbi:MAG TPA: O-antigen ligase family protein [Devosiaceae bacterium]|nr:O-antigen ligase family protein [Devosiaceae bacterium]